MNSQRLRFDQMLLFNEVSCNDHITIDRGQLHAT